MSTIIFKFFITIIFFFFSLVGAVFFSSLGLLVPAFVEIVFLSSYEGFGIMRWKLWKNVILIIFALIAMFSGALVSILDIIDTYTGSGHEVKHSHRH